MKRWSFSNLIPVLGLLFIYLPMVIRSSTRSTPRGW